MTAAMSIVGLVVGGWLGWTMMGSGPLGALGLVIGALLGLGLALAQVQKMEREDFETRRARDDATARKQGRS